ncbi:MAG: hypothetical protein IJM88_06490 [Bacteroidales bacterium]|nr:hypothetical protein [Bacteroidales bacterium]
MKRYVIVLAALLLASVTAARSQSTSKTTLKLQGIEMKEAMNEDGTALIQRPYRWFAGMAEADVQSVAVEMAQLEAYATVSRVIENMVMARAERGTMGVDGKVVKAIRSHWEQVSMSIQKACEPFGDTEVTYNSQTGMYEVIAKVGIRGDRYVKMLNEAATSAPEGLNADEAKEFVELNETIIDAAKGN